MHPSDIIYTALGRLPMKGLVYATRAPCCMCGADAMLSRDGYIKDSFNNLDALSHPNSPVICQACACCLSEKSLRSKSWLAEVGRITWLARADIWDVLFRTEKSVPFALYITTSHKKHGFFKARPNWSSERFWVQFEEVGMEFEPVRWRVVADLILQLYAIPESEAGKANPRVSFTKEEIRTGNWNIKRIQDFGVNRFAAIEERLRWARPEPAFGLLVHAVNAGIRRKTE